MISHVCSLLVVCFAQIVYLFIDHIFFPNQSKRILRNLYFFFIPHYNLLALLLLEHTVILDLFYQNTNPIHFLSNCIEELFQIPKMLVNFLE